MNLYRLTYEPSGTPVCDVLGAVLYRNARSANYFAKQKAITSHMNVQVWRINGVGSRLVPIRYASPAGDMHRGTP